MADQHATLLDSSDSIFQSVKTSEEKPVINMTLDEFKHELKYDKENALDVLSEKMIEEVIKNPEATKEMIKGWLIYGLKPLNEKDDEELIKEASIWLI